MRRAQPGRGLGSTSPLWVVGEGPGALLRGCSAPKSTPKPAALIAGLSGSPLESHGGLGVAWPAGSGMEHRRGRIWVSFGGGMWTLHPSRLGWGCGDPHITVGIRTWGTACMLLGVGTRDPRMELRNRRWGPSYHPWGQDAEILVLGSGRRDLCLGVGVRLWGALRGTWAHRGTLVLGLRYRDCFIGAGTRGHLRRDLGTSALASGLAELRAGTAAPPQGSAGWKQGDSEGRLCLSPPSSQGQCPGSPCLLQHHHPGGLRITQMWHRSCLTPS